MQAFRFVAFLFSLSAIACLFVGKLAMGVGLIIVAVSLAFVTETVSRKSF